MFVSAHGARVIQPHFAHLGSIAPGPTLIFLSAFRSVGRNRAGRKLEMRLAVPVRDSLVSRT
jgi:hypothetical protein